MKRLHALSRSYDPCPQVTGRHVAVEVASPLPTQRGRVAVWASGHAHGRFVDIMQ